MYALMLQNAMCQPHDMYASTRLERRKEGRKGGGEGPPSQEKPWRRHKCILLSERGQPEKITDCVILDM